MYSNSYEYILNQVGVVRPAGKFDSELVIVDIESAVDNCSSNYGRRGGEPPFLAEVDDAQARRAPKNRTTWRFACVQWTDRRKCEKRKGDGDYGRMHGD
jgi:hypothetical protein